LAACEDGWFDIAAAMAWSHMVVDGSSVLICTAAEEITLITSSFEQQDQVAHMPSV
jgi:hypothetical protein